MSVFLRFVPPISAASAHPSLLGAPAQATLLAATLLVGGLGSASVNAAESANLRRARLTFDLPGAPVALLPADLDGDGQQDLAVVVVATAWGEIGIEESRRLDEVEGLVEVLTVVPAVVERRELRLYWGNPQGFPP